uniref:Uncharacterized protein n=1 Tax=Manihot esculenta TaxID=3983 RepID=A0A199UBA5_MANES
MEERRKKGLCFNCDETFVRGHQCKKLSWLELEDANEESKDEDPHSRNFIQCHHRYSHSPNNEIRG